jgi:putative methyltransferase
MKKNIHIFSPEMDLYNYVPLPVVWCNLKTYYDHMGKYPDRYNWVEPVIFQMPQADKVIEQICKDPPDIFGFSGYIWNISLCYEVAAKIRELFPNCLIVAGGPQPEYRSEPGWFTKHDFIDIVVPNDGEVPFCDILNQLAEGDTDWGNVSDVILPAQDGIGFIKSNKTSPLKEYRWPASPLLSQKTLLEKYVRQIKKYNKRVVLQWESARGCPYQCTFCDWGGGTYTKVRLKPDDMVYAELDWILDQKIDTLRITDANLGMFPRDVDIVNYLCDNRQQHPSELYMSIAKQNKDRVVAIQKKLFDAKLIKFADFHIQDLDQDILKYVKRINYPWDKTLEFAQELIDYGMRVALHCIHGLPGSTVETLKFNIDNLAGSLFEYPRSHPFLLLPNSPAADPEYVEEWGLKTISRYMDTYPTVLRSDMTDEEIAQFNAGGALLTRRKDFSRVHFVIGTKDMDFDDWMKTKFLGSLVFMGETMGALKHITRYLRQDMHVKTSDFYLDLLEEFLTKPDRCGAVWNQVFGYLYEHYMHWRQDPECYYEIASKVFPRFPFAVTPDLYLCWHFLVLSKDLMPSLKEYILDRYKDEDLEDVIDYNFFIMITMDYDSSTGKSQTFRKDWHTGSPGPVTIHVQDKHYSYDNPNSEGNLMDWHEKTDADEKILQFFYRICYGVKTDRFFRSVVIDNKEDHIYNRQYGSVGEWFMPAVLKTAERASVP